MEITGLHAGKVERRAPGLGLVDGGAVDLDLAHTDGSVARDEPERGATRQRPATERPGDHGAAALDREDAVDREARSMRSHVWRGSEDPIPEVHQGGAERLDPVSIDRGDSEHRRTGQRRPGQQALDCGDHLGRPAQAQPRPPWSRRRDRDRSRARRAAPGAPWSARAARRRRPRRASPRRSRRRRRACCRPAGRGRGRRRSRARCRRGASDARSRHRSSSRAAAPRAGGPHRSRSAPAAAWSCRGRCGRRSR